MSFAIASLIVKTFIPKQTVLLWVFEGNIGSKETMLDRDCAETRESTQVRLEGPLT